MRFTVRGKVVWLASALALASCGIGAPEENSAPVVDEMLGAFSQGCSLGPWTRAALERSEGLTQIFEALKDKKSCSGSPALRAAQGAANGLRAELRSLEADQVRQRERVLDEAGNDLLLAVGQPGLDPAVRDALLGYYAGTRYELSLARAEASYLRQPGYRSSFSWGMSGVSQHLRELLAASNQLTDCYKDNPQVAVKVAASIAELAGSFSSPAVGLGASVISDLLRLGVDMAVQMPLTKEIMKSRKVRLRAALACGLEAMSRDYCRARDARTLVDVAIREPKGEVLPFFYGVELMDRHLPVLYGWLDRVVNGGGSPVDSEQAERINRQFSKLTQSQNQRRAADGLVASARNDVDRVRNVSDQADLVRRFLRDLFRVFYYNNGNSWHANGGAFAGFESVMDFVRVVAGPERTPPGEFDGDPDRLISAVQILSGADLQGFVENFNALWARRYLAVVREFNEKVNVDLSSLVRDFTRVAVDERSPARAMERLFTFLSNYAYGGGVEGDRDRILIGQVRERVSGVYNELILPRSVSDQPEEVPCPPHSGGKDGTHKCYRESPAARVISRTFESFRLENNNVYLPSVLTGLVTTDITTRYLRGEGPRQIDDLYRLAGRDLQLLLERAHLTPLAVRQDLARAQSISEANLQQFRNFSSPALGAVLEDLKKAADEAGEPVDGGAGAPNREVLAEICLLTLVTGRE
ncbi:MAG: hypothetical protein HUU37_09590, partial [Bdellovibrionales bacterium]|nr:hypothetical protein [Bdellovibrionales bacterium]